MKTNKKISNVYLKVLVTGSTGSGKTYQTLKHVKNLKQDYIYVAPCRQLVYESALKYSKNPTILTGEYKRRGDHSEIYAVYESLSSIDSKDKILIIDEAHFLTDYDRGGELYNNMLRFNHVYCLTATNNIKGIDFDHHEHIPQTQKFRYKKLESRDEFLDRCNQVPSILFASSIDDLNYEYDRLTESHSHLKIAKLSAQDDPHERLETQLEFAKGNIDLIICTNVLAQGLNFPCENVYIEDNIYDAQSLILQKIGRLGRRGLCKDNALLTYFCNYKKSEIKVKKEKVKKTKEEKIKTVRIKNDDHMLSFTVFDYEHKSHEWTVDSKRFFKKIHDQIKYREEDDEEFWEIFRKNLKDDMDNIYVMFRYSQNVLKFLENQNQNKEIANTARFIRKYYYFNQTKKIEAIIERELSN